MSDFEKFVDEVREASGNAWDDVDIGKELDQMKGRKPRTNNMPEATHTPGPWEARPDSGNAFSAWSVYAVNERNRYICTTSGNAKANAIAIAALPDLLEALQKIANIRFGYDGDCGAIAIAEAAISKATGG